MESTLIKDIADSINDNKSIKSHQEQIPFICDFASELAELQKIFKDINFENFITNLKTVKFKKEKDAQKKSFSRYNPKSNTIILYDIDRRESISGEQKYDMFKSLLDMAITKRTEHYISHGIVIKENENTALNRAVCENLLSLMLNDSRHNSLDIEMKLLYQIEEIVGDDLMLCALFNSKPKMLEREFEEKYNIKFKNIYQKIDRLMQLNLGEVKENENDSELINEIQKELISAYIISYAQKEDVNIDVSNFIENLIISDSIEIKYKTGLSNIFKNIPEDTSVVKRAIEGCKSGILNNTPQTKAM